MRNRHIMACVIASGMTLPAAAFADLVYQPNNPSFGGNPNFGAVMLNNAQAQDSTVGPDGITRRQPRTARERFEQQLERAVLSQITRAVRTDLFDDDGQLQEGTFDAGDFTVSVEEDADGAVTIITEDLITGDRTEFRVGQDGL